MKSQLHLLWVMVYLCHSISLICQIESSFLLDTNYVRTEYVEVFDEENIDFFSNGFIRSTTNVLKFNVGNPNKFSVPFYLLIGTTADIVSKDRFPNEELVFDMLNSNGGLINAGYKLSIPISPKNRSGKLNLLQQLCLKSINGFVLESGEKKSFLSYMANVGVRYDVTAWNPDDHNNKGQFWIISSASVSKNPSDVIKQFFTSSADEMFVAIHLESGITLSKGVNIKGGYYRFINNQHITGFDAGQFKLTGIYDL